MNIKPLPAPEELCRLVMAEYHGDTAHRHTVSTLCGLLCRCTAWSFEPRLKEIRPIDILRELQRHVRKHVSGETTSVIRRILHRYSVTLKIYLEVE